MRPPLSFGWVSSKVNSPFVVIVDADEQAVAQAIGITPEAAMKNARVIIYAVNKQAEVK